MGDLHAFDLISVVAATFAAAFVAGLAGFAFGIVAAGVWLHFLSPTETAALIVAFGLIVQGMAVVEVAQGDQAGATDAVLIGGAVGVPIGGEVLRWASPDSLRLALARS